MNRKTNFESVSAFNELIGNAKGAATVEQVEKQLDLIDSELDELKEGVALLKEAAVLMAAAENEDELASACRLREQAIIMIRDGVSDVLVTTYGMAHRVGFDADKDMKAVSESNFSKFFEGTEAEAAEVCKALTDSLGIAVESRQRAVCAEQAPDPEPTRYVWAFVSADDSDPERPRGKLLKAPGYKPPVFD